MCVRKPVWFVGGALLLCIAALAVSAIRSDGRALTLSELRAARGAQCPGCMLNPGADCNVIHNDNCAQCQFSNSESNVQVTCPTPTWKSYQGFWGAVCYTPMMNNNEICDPVKNYCWHVRDCDDSGLVFMEMCTDGPPVTACATTEYTVYCHSCTDGGNPIAGPEVSVNVCYGCE